MKTYIKQTAISAALLIGMTACSENAWNDHLDGFEEPGVYDKTEILTYTLTEADYTTLSGLSANKAIASAEGEESEAALKAIGTNKAFATEAEARKYLPAFMSNSDFPHFTLNDGSSIKISYELMQEEPELLTAINATYTGSDDKLHNENVETYTVSLSDYQEAWESIDDYISAFAPMLPAANSIPSILANNFDEAKEGDMVFVNYNETAQNPIFGTGGAAEKITDISSLSNGKNATVKGTVTAICKRGFILTDDTGSINVYESDFDATSVAIGSQVKLTGAVQAYATGLQFKDVAFTVEGTGTYTYPTPIVYTAAMIDADAERTSDSLAKYISVTGTATIDGDYVNVAVEGATHTVSLAYLPAEFKALLKENTAQTFTGYYIYNSGSSKYFNIMVTAIDGNSSSKLRVSHKAPAGIVPTTPKCALYRFEGNSWKIPTDIITIQPGDYTAMGLNNANFSSSAPASKYVPTLLSTTLPYAADDTKKTVVYQYYASSSTYVQASEFVKSEGTWGSDTYRVEKTDQFARRAGAWVFDPSIEMTLPYSRNTEPSYTYYMACVNWVFDHISKPDFGATTLTSAAFIDYRGNAEFYGGSSAYYGNVDVRAYTAKKNMPEGYTGYDGLTDDEISLLVKKRFCTEVMKGALSIVHPDAAPVEGVEVLYTFHFTAYADVEGTARAMDETIVYEVVGPAQFKYRSCTWFQNGEDEGWE